MLSIFYIYLVIDRFDRWVYKRIFVADGNFKADHVRQKDAGKDVWLSEGSGMVPKREEYMEFLKHAIERLTVSWKFNADYSLTYIFGITSTRRHLVRIIFKLL
jgi:hypothetical protein